MHVGIDYWPATTHAPGVGRYARELVRALVARRDQPALTLLRVGIGRQVLRDLGLETPHGPLRRRRIPLPRRLLGVPWMPAADALAGGPDVFHHILPGVARVERARQTIALSEIPRTGSAGAERLSAMLRPMDAILVFGEAAAKQAHAVLGVEHERLRVVPVGCDHWVRDHQPHAVPDAPPTLLVLGSPTAARQPGAILGAWDRLRDRGLDCRLRFVGGPAPVGSDFDQQVAHRDGVTHDLPRESRLPEIVSRAAVLVHLAENEITAVTPLEAFSFGLAVVASELPAFEEALDGEATLLESRRLEEDPDRLADALASALESADDETGRTRRRAVAARFTWERNASATRAVWAGLLD